jgi:hypothetical protein
MTDDLVALSIEGVAIFSLLDVFAKEKVSIYVDSIHYGRGDSLGNRLVAQAMAGNMATAWGLERTCSSQ